MLVKRIETASDLAEEFKAMGRESYFSYEGYEALVDMFNEYMGDVDLDVIAICCDYDEYDPAYVADTYRWTYNDLPYLEAVKEYGEDIINDELMEYLNYHSWAQMLDNGNILYAQF